MANVKEVPKLAQLPTPITADKLLLRMGIYGEGGVGKTKLALSFPKPLVIDTDAGLEGGAIDGVTGDQWAPEAWRDINALYFWLKDQITRRGYKTIVLDSISSFCTLIRREAMQLELGMRPANSGYDQLTQAEKPDFNKVATAVDDLLVKLLLLQKTFGVHIVLTSGVRPPNVEKGRMKRSFDVQPAVEDSLTYWLNTYGEYVALELPKKLDGVVQKDKDGEVILAEHRVLWTKASDPLRRNKTRFAALLPGITDPTYDKITKLIGAGK